jgi:hypothetical protein
VLIVAAALVVVVVLGIVGIAIDGQHTGTSASSGSHASAVGSSAAPSQPTPATSGPSSPAPGSSAPAGSVPPSAPASPAGPLGTVSTGPLDSYLLSPTEVGAVGMALIDGGRSVSTDNATLDWCGRSYSSDQLRTGRVQVEYVGSDLFISNEFVKYTSGGTTKAYQQIQAAVAACQPSFVDQGTTTSQIQVAAHSSAFVGDQVTVTAYEAGEVPLWTAVVYQFDGSFFSGVYVSGSSRASVLADADQLGAQAATHLREAVAGKPGSGGGTVGTAPAGSSPAGGGIQT